MIFIIYANGLAQPKTGRVHAMNYGINLNRDMPGLPVYDYGSLSPIPAETFTLVL